MKFAVAKLINSKAIGVLFCPMMSVKNGDANSFLIWKETNFEQNKITADGVYSERSKLGSNEQKMTTV